MPNIELSLIQEKENNVVKQEKIEDFGYNSEIKKIGDNLQKKFPIDFNDYTFGNIVKTILLSLEKQYSRIESEKIVLKFGEKVFEEIMKKDIGDFKNENFEVFILFISGIDKKDNMDTNKDNIDTNKDNIDKIINNLNILHENVDIRYKGNKEELKKFKNNYLDLEKENKLRNNGINPDDYIRYRYTAQQLSKSGDTIPGKYEFIKSFNQLNKLLDIDIQIPLTLEEKVNYKPLPDSLDDFQSQPSKILALDSIQDYIQQSPNTIQDTHIPDQDIIKLYSDGISDAITEILSKNNLDPSLIKYFDIKNYDQKTGILDKKVITEIQDDKLLNQLQQISQAVSAKFIKQGKEEVSKITNKIIKEKIMTSIFRGVSDFFDITNDNIENFANDFKLDFNQDLNFANNIINIQGQISGSHIGLHYDLVLGKLSMDDVISFDPGNKLYKISKQSGSFLDIPIKLPRLKDFQDDALKFDYKYLAKKSDNLDQYQSNLNQQLGSVFYGNFVHKELNQYYIHRLNEKNLAVQSGLSYMLNNFRSSVGSDPSFNFDGLESNSFTEDGNSDHFRLIKMLDDSFDYYNRSGDFLKIRNLFEKFNMLINSSKVKDGNASEKLINILFNSTGMKTSASSWQSMGNNGNFNYLQFYDLISKSRSGENIIDINLLENVVDVLGKGEQFSDKDNKKKFNSSFWNKYEKIVNDPDKDLENKLNKI